MFLMNDSSHSLCRPCSSKKEIRRRTSSDAVGSRFIITNALGDPTLRLMVSVERRSENHFVSSLEFVASQEISPVNVNPVDRSSHQHHL